jgi:hypothetical protein
MADITIRIDDFEEGLLPDRCVVSGRPAPTHYIVRAHRQPWWPLAFLLLGPVGWLVVLIVLAGTHRSVAGSLPFDEEVQRTSATSRRARWLGAIVSAVTGASVVLVAGGAGYTDVAVLGGLAGLITTAGFWLAAQRPRGSIGLKLSRDGRFVIVRGGAPEFASAYERQEQVRRADRRRLAHSA